MMDVTNCQGDHQIHEQDDGYDLKQDEQKVRDPSLPLKDIISFDLTDHHCLEIWQIVTFEYGDKYRCFGKGLEHHQPY